MELDSTFMMILNSLKDNNGYDDSVFDEFIDKFEEEYTLCKKYLSKKLTNFLEKNDFLHDSIIAGLSVNRYLSNKNYLCDIKLQIITPKDRKVYTIIYQKVSKFTFEKYTESDSGWAWGYGYIKKLVDNCFEQGIICFPCILIKIKCKKIVLRLE